MTRAKLHSSSSKTRNVVSSPLAPSKRSRRVDGAFLKARFVTPSRSTSMTSKGLPGPDTSAIASSKLRTGPLSEVILDKRPSRAAIADSYTSR